MQMRLYFMTMFAVVVTGTPAVAGGTCDDSSLAGSYAFHTEGANLGLLDASGALHPFKEPEPFAGVGEYTFDGNGHFTRVDYNTGLGTPAFPPSPVNDQGFRMGVVGSYSVSEDCTATFVIRLSATQQITLAVAVVNYGQQGFGTIKSESVGSFPPANNTSDLPCDSGCNVAVQLTHEIVQNSPRRR